MREWNASPPIPTPHCCRNHRRDSRRRSASFVVVIPSLFRDRLVQVQQDPRERRPGAPLKRSSLARQVPELRVSPRQPLLLPCEEPEKQLSLLLGGLPGRAPAERPLESFRVG